MGSTFSCEPCNCFGGPDVIKGKASFSSSDGTNSSSMSDSETSDEEQKPLKHKRDKKKKKKSKKKRNKYKREESESQLRDESYFSESSEHEDSSKDRKKKKKKKRSKKDKKHKKDKKDKKDKKHKKKDKKKDKKKGKEILPEAAEAINANPAYYGMDTKTIELIYSLNPNQQESPIPSMPTILSNDIEYDPGQPGTNNQSIPSDHMTAATMDDMKLQLQSYDSNDMYNGPIHAMRSPDTNNSNMKSDEDAYDALMVEDEDHNDLTPALPINGDGTIIKQEEQKLSVELKKSLGGLDYDDENENEQVENNKSTLKPEEKNVTTKRIEAISQKSQAEKIEELVRAQYGHDDTDTDHTDDTDHSDSLSDGEKQEIIRVKTEEMEKMANKLPAENPKTSNSKSKLFRPGTTTPWDEQAMQDAMDEMSAWKSDMEEMEKRRIGENGNNKDKDMSFMGGQYMKNADVESDVDLFTDDDMVDDKIEKAILKSAENDKMDKKTSKLFRYKSAYKWDNEELEKQNKEMQDQLVDLMKAHQNSIEPKPNQPMPTVLSTGPTSSP